MCGLTLIIDRRGQPVHRSLLERSNTALRHRGPDEQSCFQFENVGLAHTRLSIVDVAGGQQPIFNEDRTLLLMCNGEIYNHAILRADLESRHHSFRTGSDSEVLLHLYEENPHGFINAIDGMFAFALLDMRRRVVVLGRDRLGIKPLFIHENSEFWVASSEIKGIFASGLSPRQLDARSIYDSFTFSYPIDNTTAFKGIRSLPPGSLETFELNGRNSAEHVYWRPTLSGSRKQIRADADLSNDLVTLLRQAVLTHTMGDGPVGAYLSGGIDSTIIAMLLGEVVRTKGARLPLETFTIRFSDESFDESVVALNTAQQCGFNAHIVDMDTWSAKELYRAIYHLEQPQLYTLDVPYQRLSRQVAAQKRKVVLTGDGSDELLGGYKYFALNELRRKSLGASPSSRRRDVLRSGMRRLAMSTDFQNHYLDQCIDKEEEIVRRFGFFPPWYPSWTMNSHCKQGLFRDVFSDSLGDGARMVELCRAVHELDIGADDFNKSIYLELQTRLPGFILWKSDRNTMAGSVEARVPFLDNTMIEFLCAIPTSLKIRHLQDKFILRRAFRNLVPNEVTRRGKFAFNSPSAWLLDDEHTLVNDLLSDESLRHVGLFEPSRVAALRAEAQRQRTRPASEQNRFLFYAFVGVLTTQMLHYSLVEERTP